MLLKIVFHLFLLTVYANVLLNCCLKIICFEAGVVYKGCMKKNGIPIKQPVEIIHSNSFKWSRLLW